MRLTDRTQVALVVANSLQSPVMAEVCISDWPQEFRRAHKAPGYRAVPLSVWRSKEFLAVLYAEGEHRRLSINRTTLSSTRLGHFEDGITWDELMRVKRECGYGDTWAVEVYPPCDDVVDVANMRHLWLLESAPAYSWRRP